MVRNMTKPWPLQKTRMLLYKEFSAHKRMSLFILDKPLWIFCSCNFYPRKMILKFWVLILDLIHNC